ncbi:hypothetical protein RI367_001582 [Sorochytrium milnesiophthora]
MRLVLAQQRVTVNFRKIAANTGVTANEYADALATAAYDHPTIPTSNQIGCDLPYQLYIRREGVSNDPRRAMRLQQHCRSEIDWDVPTQWLHGGTHPRSCITSTWHSKIFSFQTKAPTGMLPTRPRLLALYLAAYPRATCPRCRAGALYNGASDIAMALLPDEDAEHLRSPYTQASWNNALRGMYAGITKALRRHRRDIALGAAVHAILVERVEQVLFRQQLAAG